ncbi:hypothetical protein [Sulfitobacter sp.]|uniref:hypothetical protein n=1 Tax=Sulfitobacter sp. TaxID=1903071 RepID=UPI003002F0F1
MKIISVKSGKAVMNGDMEPGFTDGVGGKGVTAGELVDMASGLSIPPDAPKLTDLGMPFSCRRMGTCNWPVRLHLDGVSGVCRLPHRRMVCAMTRIQKHVLMPVVLMPVVLPLTLTTPYVEA